MLQVESCIQMHKNECLVSENTLLYVRLQHYQACLLHGNIKAAFATLASKE